MNVEVIYRPLGAGKQTLINSMEVEAKSDNLPVGPG
jgi:hypothetical protein